MVWLLVVGKFKMEEQFLGIHCNDHSSNRPPYMNSLLDSADLSLSSLEVHRQWSSSVSQGFLCTPGLWWCSESFGNPSSDAGRVQETEMGFGPQNQDLRWFSMIQGNSLCIVGWTNRESVQLSAEDAGKGNSPVMWHDGAGGWAGKEVQVPCLCSLVVLEVRSWSSYMMGAADIQTQFNFWVSFIPRSRLESEQNVYGLCSDLPDSQWCNTGQEQLGFY